MRKLDYLRNLVYRTNDLVKLKYAVLPIEFGKTAYIDGINVNGDSLELFVTSNNGTNKFTISKPKSMICRFDIYNFSRSKPEIDIESYLNAL
nr:MAG TPA: hypothetical protein [Caudoviricetes sp.]